MPIQMPQTLQYAIELIEPKPTHPTLRPGNSARAFH